MFSCTVNSNDSSSFEINEDNKYEKISLNLIIDSPKRYDSIDLKTSGIFVFEYENVALYKDKISALLNDRKNAIWVEFNSSSSYKSSELKKLNNRRVFLVGRFNSKRKGHLSKYKGQLNTNEILLK
ncbi:hypothetical protein DCC35_10900 [Mangrovivirga cuniculi]|uniref:Uncharacterized protein n=2 Tax=Mangrovivirga cuniculi TaxID=2715131 RepID=A0A4D7JSW4_9BACT|nr:hypothetical protein DCC35_10900 [Mangrovivirga cuniculi]